MPSTANAATGGGGYGGSSGVLSRPTNGILSNGVHGTPRIADETRPKNVTLLPMIKAADGVHNPGLIDVDALAQLVNDHEARVANLEARAQPWESAEISITVGTRVELPYVLANRPRRWSTFLKCVTANLGYDPGEELLITQGGSGTGDNNNGPAVWFGVDRLYVRFASVAPRITNDTDGANAVLTAANWRLIVRAEPWKI